MQVWWEKILQRHSCHNSSQQGARIGDLHHLSHSSRLVTPLAGGHHHHTNTRCIDFAHCAPRPAHSVHPAARAEPLKPFIQSAHGSITERTGRSSYGVGSYTNVHTAGHQKLYCEYRKLGKRNTKSRYTNPHAVQIFAYAGHL